MRTRSACITVLLAVSAATLTIAACSPDATAPVPADDTRLALDRRVKELNERYGWIGQYHTDGLEFVFAELSKHPGKATQEQLCRRAARALKAFHRQARKGEVPFALVDPAIEAESCGAEASQARIGKNVIVGAPRLAANDLSSLAASYMDQIGHTVATASSREWLLGQVLNIQYAAVTNLSGEEAGAVVAVASIAISSMDYWEAHLHEWVNLGTVATPYSRSGAESMIPIAIEGSAIAKPKWWSNPYVQNYRKVLAADAMGGARVLYTTWRLGVIGWDAAAAAALFASVTMTFSLLF